MTFPGSPCTGDTSLLVLHVDSDLVEPVVVGIHGHVVPHGHPLVLEHAPLRQKICVLPGVLVEWDHIEALPRTGDDLVGVCGYTLCLQEGWSTRVSESVAGSLES
jgi:hypothetical protein